MSYIRALRLVKLNVRFVYVTYFFVETDNVLTKNETVIGRRRLYSSVCEKVILLWISGIVHFI